MARLAPGLLIGAPSWLMLPDERLSSPPMQRNKVDLPQPDAPTKVTNSLFSMSKLIFCNATTPPLPSAPFPKVLFAEMMFILMFIFAVFTCFILRVAKESFCDATSGKADQSTSQSTQSE